MATGGRRRLTIAGLALALVVAACAAGSSPASGLPGESGAVASGGSILPSGLASNLDSLTSYRFSWSSYGTTSDGGASPSTAGFSISGTVINSPTKAIAVSYGGVQYVQVGETQWSSLDGARWFQAATDSSVNLTLYLPTNDYPTWFDANAGLFSAGTQETKNGVVCIHYKGSDSLAQIYGAVAGVSAGFVADLWIAKDGLYPVSGAYGFTTSSGGQTGSFGYQFDITNVNDPSNAVTPPSNVVASPS